MDNNVSGYTVGTKAYALNEIHCMLQELETSIFEAAVLDGRETIEFNFTTAFALIEDVRDKPGE